MPSSPSDPGCSKAGYPLVKPLPVDSVIYFANTYPLNSDLCKGLRDPAFEQLEPGVQKYQMRQLLKSDESLEGQSVAWVEICNMTGFVSSLHPMATMQLVMQN